MKTKSGGTAVQVVYLSRGGLRSAVASLRTTRSGVCFFLLAVFMSNVLACNVGRKPLTRPGSTAALVLLALMDLAVFPAARWWSSAARPGWP